MALRFAILDSMMDDAEDIEQLYLSVNRAGFATGPFQPKFFLRDVVDEIVCLIEGGLIEAKYSNDQARCPLNKLEPTLLHHYWFAPTKSGMELWKRSKETKSST